jgi:hypothetical protein
MPFFETSENTDREEKEMMIAILGAATRLLTIGSFFP